MITQKEIARRIHKHQGPSLPGFKTMNQKAVNTRARKIYNYLIDRSDRLKNECQNYHHHFPRQIYAKKYFVGKIYNTPWDNVPKEKYFCSQECMYECIDNNFFDCSECNKTIYRENPHSSIHTQYRITEYDEEICLSCYEKGILENGIPRERFEEKQISGMFFSWGNNEPLEQGFEEVEDFSNFFIRSQESINRYCQKAIELIDQGFLVVTGYEELAITGSEGYITMFSKKRS